MIEGIDQYLSAFVIGNKLYIDGGEETRLNNSGQAICESFQNVECLAAEPNSELYACY